jgi:ubiquitin-like-conjugating enzyme ATG10
MLFTLRCSQACRLNNLQFGTRYLCITRRVPSSSLASQSSGDSQTGEDEEAIEEDDPEALVAPIGKNDHERVVQCDVVYSPSYQVPVLYLTFADRSTNRSVSLPSPDGVYEILVPAGFKAAMRSVGLMGALSMAEHPVTGAPAYFLHPCRTQEAMSPLLDNATMGYSEADPRKATNYLMLWFGMIGASVGLSVPVNVAKLLADGRGDALAGLGKC